MIQILKYHETILIFYVEYKNIFDHLLNISGSFITQNETTAFFYITNIYLMIRIGVREWNIIFFAILGLNRRAKTFLL